MALTPEEKSQTGVDRVAAGFARAYGGTETDLGQFNHIYTGVVMEAVNSIIGTEGIAVPKSAARKQELNQALAQLYYTAMAASVLSTTDAPDNMKRHYWAQARGINQVFETAYPADIVTKAKAGVLGFIAQRWPEDTLPDNLGIVLGVDDSALAAAKPRTTGTADSLLRQNYRSLFESVVQADAAIGMGNSQMLSGAVEAAALGWLGKSAMATVAKTLPSTYHSHENLNVFSMAYSSSIVAAEWFAMTGTGIAANDEAADLAMRRTEHTSSKLRAQYSDEDLIKIADAFFERAKAAAGMTGKKGRQDELKRFVYMSVGAPISGTGSAPPPPTAGGGSDPQPRH